MSSEKVYCVVALSHFHEEKGPRIFSHYPKGFIEEKVNILEDIFDIWKKYSENGVFISNPDYLPPHFLSNNLIILNHYFSIQSEQTQRRVEPLLISIILYQALIIIMFV